LKIVDEATAVRKVVALGHILDTPHLGPDSAPTIARRVARVADVLLLWGSQGKRVEAAASHERSGLIVRTFDTQSDLAAHLRRETRAGDLILLKGYWFDHMSRIVYRQFGAVGCDRSHCTLVWLCGRCSRLRFRAAPEHPRSLLARLPAARS